MRLYTTQSAQRAQRLEAGPSADGGALRLRFEAKELKAESSKFIEDKYVSFTQCENGYNSLDMPAGDHDISNGKDGGESGDTGHLGFEFFDLCENHSIGSENRYKDEVSSAIPWKLLDPKIAFRC